MSKVLPGFDSGTLTGSGFGAFLEACLGSCFGGDFFGFGLTKIRQIQKDDQNSGL